MRKGGIISASREKINDLTKILDGVRKLHDCHKLNLAMLPVEKTRLEEIIKYEEKLIPQIDAELFGLKVLESQREHITKQREQKKKL